MIVGFEIRTTEAESRHGALLPPDVYFVVVEYPCRYKGNKEKLLLIINENELKTVLS